MEELNYYQQRWNAKHSDSIHQQIEIYENPNIHQIDELYLPYRVDLIIIKDIKDQDLLDHINRVGQVFYPNTP